MTRTYKIELEFEVKMTYAGAPATGPSYSSGGEPPEPPEFEIQNCSFADASTFIESMYKKHKETGGIVPPGGFDQFFIDKIYEKVLDMAYADVWEPEDYSDYDHD